MLTTSHVCGYLDMSHTHHIPVLNSGSKLLDKLVGLRGFHTIVRWSFLRVLSQVQPAFQVSQSPKVIGLDKRVFAWLESKLNHGRVHCGCLRNRTRTQWKPVTIWWDETVGSFLMSWFKVVTNSQCRNIYRNHEPLGVATGTATTWARFYFLLCTSRWNHHCPLYDQC